MPNNLDLTFYCVLCVNDKLQHKALFKQGSCAVRNVSDIFEVAEGNKQFRSLLTAILPLLVFWYSCCLYVVVCLIYVTFLQLSITRSYHLSLLFVAGCAGVFDDQFFFCSV
jgi:hypothetical protein